MRSTSATTARCGCSATRSSRRAPSSCAWSDAEDVFTPPESAVDDAFVYAGKAHAFLPVGDGIAVTYADNSFTFGDLFEPANANTLYWPHVAQLTLRTR